MKKTITRLIILFIIGWVGINSLKSQAVLYGVTTQGGTNDSGVLFEYDPATNTYTKKFDFGGSNGSWPSSSLLLHDGKFIGLALEGGGSGVIYEWDPVAQAYLIRHNFDNANGGAPAGDLTLYQNKIYGTTTGGGAYGHGIIFEYDPVSNTFTNKYDFLDENGYAVYPMGCLALYNGKFYGVTGIGGPDYYGYIYEWDPGTNLFTKKFEFDELNGNTPFGALTLYQGKFYGITSAGGPNGAGVIFSWDPATNIYSIEYGFNYPTGGFPAWSFTLYEDKFYGHALSGPSGCGVIYTWDPLADIYAVEHIFGDSEYGCSPQSQLILSGGKFYGTTYDGGTINGGAGVLFEWNPVTGNFSKEFDFGGANGSYPQQTALLEYILPGSDNDGDGFSPAQGDCNDEDPAIYPGAAELCNGIDDNCDGDIDEGFVYSVAGATVSSSEGGNFCLGATTYLSVTGGILGTEADWVWYEGGCANGDPIGTGETIAVTPSEGIHTYYVRAEGICNTSECTYTVITVDKAPGFQVCPGDITAGNDAGSCFATVYYNVSATGSPAPAISYAFFGATTGSDSGTGSGNNFNAGTTTVTLTAENYCGTETCTFSVTVNDTEGPAINDCPSDITLEAEEGQWGASVSWIPPSAPDNCSSASLVSNYDPGHFFNVGSTPVTYTATDESGNSSSCQFLVTVTPPDFLGSVNLSAISSEITFSDNNPAPGSLLSVNALIRNNSNIDAGSFSVQFTDLYTNTSYPLIAIPGLSAGQSILVNQLISAPNVPAFVPVQVSVDVTNILDESSEFDNAAVRPFLCGDVSLPGEMDLMASAVPAAVPAGTVIQICGSASYETNPPLNDPSVAGAEVVISIVETEEQFSGYTDEDGNFCILYGTPNTPGEYHFTVEITDNILSGDAEGSFTLSAPVNPCPTDLSLLIDLPGIASSYSGSAVIAAGTSFTGTIFVQNNCSAITEQTTLFIAPPAGTVNAYEVLIPPLGPGETYPVALPVLTMNTTGEFFLSATVDFNNQIEEDQENNNTEYIALIVKPALPDIVVAGAELVSNRACFENNKVMFTILNSGLVATGPFTSVFNLYVNGILQSTQSQIIQNLGPGDYTKRSFVFNVPSEDDLIGFELFNDPDDEIVELSELNNDFAFESGFKPCLPDLEVKDCSFTDVKPADAMSAGMASITATIVNLGESSLTEPFDVAFIVGNTTITETVNGPLAPQQSVQVTVESPVPVDDCTSLSITADPDNDITEHRNDNNFFNALLCYDFELTNFSCGGGLILSQTQYFCDPGQFRTGYLNHGLYEASDLQIRFEISGPGLTGWVLLGTESVYAGNTCGCPLILDFPGSFYFPQTGTYQVRMTADPEDLYPESNESNNELTVSFDVVETSDYEVLAPYIFPSKINPEINEAVSFSVSYTNNGCDGSTPIELYTMVDNDPLASVTVVPLLSGDWNTVAIPQTWSSSVPGVHVFRAIIDYGEAVAEGNELNNEATKAIYVGGAPDYHVVFVSASDESPVTGQDITLTADVLNEGQSAGSGLLQFLRADANGQETLITEEPIAIAPGNTQSFSTSWLVTHPGAKIIARVAEVLPIDFDLSDNEKDTQLNDLLVSLAGTDALCQGESSGTITVNVTGGTPPFSFAWSDPSLFGPVVTVAEGTYSVTVTDIYGLAASGEITIASLSVPETWYEDADNDGFGDASAIVMACEQPAGYVSAPGDCDDNNAAVHPGATEICENNLDDNCDGQVDEGCDISCDLTVDAGPDVATYFGIVSQQTVTRTATVSGGTAPYTFSWSLGRPLLCNQGNNSGDEAFYGGTCQDNTCPASGSPVNTAICSGSATITATLLDTALICVTVTDASGCTATACFTVNASDIRCVAGNSGNHKVKMCHSTGNPNNPWVEICVDTNSIDAHLAHGDYLGLCDFTKESEEDLVEHQEFHFHLYPNPASRSATLSFISLTESIYAIEVLNMTGHTVYKEEGRAAEGENARILDFPGYARGIYLVKLNVEGNQVTEKVIIQ